MDPYSIPSLEKARNDLKGRIAQLKLCYDLRDSQPPLNMWEGEAGMMEHITINFPVPSMTVPSVTDCQELSESSKSDACSIASSSTYKKLLSANQEQDQVGDKQKRIPQIEKPPEYFFDSSGRLISATPRLNVQSKNFNINNTSNFTPDCDVIVIDDEDENGNDYDDSGRGNRKAAHCSEHSHQSVVPTASTSSSNKTAVKSHESSENHKRMNIKDNDLCSLSVNNESVVNKVKESVSPSRLLYDQSMPYRHYLKFNSGEQMDLTSEGPHAISRMEIKIDFDARHVSSSFDTKYAYTGNRASYMKEEDENTSKDADHLNLNSVASGDQLALDPALRLWAKADNMFPAKIEEWAASVEYIQSIFNGLQMSLSSDHQVLEGYPERFYQSWRQVCFLIECIHADMEVLRMSMNPENTQRKFILTVDLIKQIGNLTARKTSKKFQQLKASLRSMRNALRAHYNCNKAIFKDYNKKVKNVELMIKTPGFPLLSQHKRYLHYQQNKPLILPMTPGLAAGLYGKEERMLDRYSNWLTQFNASSKGRKLKTSPENRQPAEAMRKPEQSCTDLMEDTDFQGLCSLSSAQKNNSITHDSDLSDLVNSGRIQTTDNRQDNANQEQNGTSCETVRNDLETHQENESNTDAAELFNSKFLEWELREKYMRHLLQLTKGKITKTARSSKRCNLSTDKNLRTLAELCYLIEHFYFQMESEKLVAEPKNKTNRWLFSAFFTSKLGQVANCSFSKRHQTIHSHLKKSVQIIDKLYQLNKVRFRQFNRTVKHDDLKIRVPILAHLSKSNRLAKLIQTSETKSKNQGFEEAFFSKEKNILQLPLMLTMQPIDLSLCQVIKFNEAFLKQPVQDRPKLYTEFQNLCQNLESLASEIESRFVELEAGADLRRMERISSTNIDCIIETTCKTLICAISPLQSLFTQFVCLVFSITDTSCYFTKRWRLFETVSKMVGEKSKDIAMCEKLNMLFSTLKGLEKKCYQIFQRNINIIMIYNEQVDRKCKVQLPRLISDLSAQIKVLVSQGSIPAISSPSIASFQEKTVTLLDSIRSSTTPSSTCQESNQGQKDGSKMGFSSSPIGNRDEYFLPSVSGNSYINSKLNEKDMPLTFLGKEKAKVGAESQESPLLPNASGLNTKSVHDISRISTSKDKVQVSAEAQENIVSGTSGPNKSNVQDIYNISTCTGKDKVQVSAEAQGNVDSVTLTVSGTSGPSKSYVQDIPNSICTGKDKVQVAAETQENIDSGTVTVTGTFGPNKSNEQDIPNISACTSNDEIQVSVKAQENIEPAIVSGAYNANAKNVQDIQSNGEVQVEVFMLMPHSDSDPGFNFKLNNYQDLMINSLIDLELERTDHFHNTCLSDQYLHESVRDADHCKCGCYGVPLISSLNYRAAVDEPLWLRLYLLHIDIQNLKDCLIEAEAGMASCKIPQPTHCKLIVDVSATILYLQTVLNKESYNAYRYGCEDLSAISEEKLNMVGLCHHDVVTIDFQAVEMLLEFVNDDLNRIMIEKQKFILLFFPHAEESRKKRDEPSQILPPYKSNVQVQPKTTDTKKKKKPQKANKPSK